MYYCGHYFVLEFILRPRICYNCYFIPPIFDITQTSGDITNHIHVQLDKLLDVVERTSVQNENTTNCRIFLFSSKLLVVRALGNITSFIGNVDLFQPKEVAITIFTSHESTSGLLSIISLFRMNYSTKKTWNLMVNTFSNLNGSRYLMMSVDIRI